MDGNKIGIYSGIAFVCVHLVVSIAMAIFGVDLLELTGDFTPHVLVLMFAFVQCSLLGTWAILGSGPFWLRTPLGFVLLGWVAFSLVRVIVPWLNEPEMNFLLTLMIFFQFICIAGIIFSIQIFLKLVRMENYLEGNTQFSLGTLLIFTTLVAVALGVGKFIFQTSGFSLDTLQDTANPFLRYPFTSFFNGVAVVLMLPPLWVHRWQLKLVLALPLLILAGVSGVVEQYLFKYLFVEDPPPWFLFPAINLGQALLFYITVLPLWRWKTTCEDYSEIETDKLALNGIKD